MLTWAPSRQRSTPGTLSRVRARRVRSMVGIGIAAASVGVGLFGTELANTSTRDEQGSSASAQATGEVSASPASPAASPAEVMGRVETPSRGSVPGASSTNSDAVAPAAGGAQSGASGVEESRTIGSLPAIAAGEQASAREIPSSLTSALPAWRLSAPVSYASGAIKARPLPRSVSPIRRRAAITAIATKLASQQFGGSLRPADVDTFFGEFDAPVGEWLGKVESIETEPRSVWFVVFTGMESSRSTGVVIRRRDAATAPTTTSLRVISDVVVVIDDDTGEVLVASEFLSETNPTR